MICLLTVKYRCRSCILHGGFSRQSTKHGISWASEVATWLSESVCPVQPSGKRLQRALWLSTRNVRLPPFLPCFRSPRACSACKAVPLPLRRSCQLRAMRVKG